MGSQGCGKTGGMNVADGARVGVTACVRVADGDGVGDGVRVADGATMDTPSTRKV